MKALLYSSYSAMPNFEIIDMLGDKENKTCLFCCYADELADDYIKRTKDNLAKVFNRIIDLDENYKFNDEINCVFMNGGNVFELIFKLKKYGQFEKIKDMCRNDVLFIGNSAGSELFAYDNYFISQFEPPAIEMDIKDNSMGFGFVNKSILVHASKYRVSHRHGLIFDKDSWHNYVKYKLKQKDNIKIANNAVVIINGSEIKTKKYSWKYLVELNKIS